MARWIDALARRFGYVPARRGYSAAVSSRLTSGWQTQNYSANVDLFNGLDVLRARSRDLCLNNDYAKRYLEMVCANVIGGSGILLQARVYDAPGKPDDSANEAIESAWERWCNRGVCDVTGRMSWRDLQIQIIRAVARDGEALIRKVRGASAGNDFGFALQVLDIDRLDTRLMRAPGREGNEIRMGVEIDRFGRAMAYWLRPYHPGDTWQASAALSTEHVRLPAEDVIHAYIPDRPEQLRGAPWMHAAMTRLNNLGAYEEAAVIAARVGASKMGFYRTPEGDVSDLDVDGVDASGVPFTEADPGQFGVLPAGADFVNFNPDYPHAMFSDFVRATLRGIASGLNVSYHTLGNDLEGVNYSSIRSGTLEERDQWISLQEWFKCAVCDPVYADWLRHALAMGRVRLASGRPLPLDRIEKFSDHTWQGRRWPWVDPLKDMEASVVAVKNRFKAPQDVVAELGGDFEDTLVKIRQAEEMAAKIGVDIRVAEQKIASGDLS